jgi:hypothetical protein
VQLQFRVHSICSYNVQRTVLINKRKILPVRSGFDSQQNNEISFPPNVDTGPTAIHLSAQYISYSTGIWNRQRLSIYLEVQNVSISKQINCNYILSCRWYQKSAVPSIILNDLISMATALRGHCLVQKSVLVLLLRLSVARRPHISMNMRVKCLDDLCPMSHKTH